MSDFNQCTFTGRLGADPEIRRTQDGRPIVNIRLAVSDQWRDKTTGEKRERTTWVPVVIFAEGLAKVAETYLKKGSRILVQGAFSVRDWEAQDGTKRYATEIVLQGFNSTLIMLDGPSGGGARNDGDRAPRGGSSDGRSSFGQGSQAPAMTGDMDDEIPFAPDRT